jgi:hypothetical protein
MPGRAIPKLQKAYDLSRKKKQLYDLAVKQYADEMNKPPHVRKGARQQKPEI